MPYGAAPLLSFKLRVTIPARRIDPHRSTARANPNRGYSPPLQQRGTVQASRPVWRAGSLGPNAAQSSCGRTQLSIVPPFAKETVVELQVPCTFDFNVAATKYFHGLADGDLPLNFLFSGTVFYPDRERPTAGGADFLGEGSEIQAASESLEGLDRSLLSQQRLALFAARRV